MRSLDQAFKAMRATADE